MALKDVSVVLAHGAWADESSWARVITALKTEAVKVVAAPLPLEPDGVGYEIRWGWQVWRANGLDARRHQATKPRAGGLLSGQKAANISMRSRSTISSPRPDRITWSLKSCRVSFAGSAVVI
jgi:hypothetical protein